MTAGSALLVMLSSKKSTVQRLSLVLADLYPGPGLILERYKTENVKEVHTAKKVWVFGGGQMQNLD